MTILLFSLAALIVTGLGGFLALRKQTNLPTLLSISAGAVIGVALFDLLPEAFELALPRYTAHTVALVIASGFFGFMLLSHVLGMHAHGDQVGKGWVGALSLSVHSYIDGLAVGLALQVSPVVGGVVVMAVLAHDFFDGVNTVSYIKRHGGTQMSALRWLSINALTPVIGISTAQYLVIADSILGLALGVFCGFFLFIGASDLLPESQHGNPRASARWLTILGAGIIYGATRLAGH